MSFVYNLIKHEKIDQLNDWLSVADWSIDVIYQSLPFLSLSSSLDFTENGKEASKISPKKSSRLKNKDKKGEKIKEKENGKAEEKSPIIDSKLAGELYGIIINCTA